MLTTAFDYLIIDEGTTMNITLCKYLKMQKTLNGHISFNIQSIAEFIFLTLYNEFYRGHTNAYAE